MTRSYPASSKVLVLPVVRTNLAFFGRLWPSMMAMARLRCWVRVCRSRTARFLRYCQTARHWSVFFSGSQTGSVRLSVRDGSAALVRMVMVSTVCPSSWWLPCQWK